MADEHPIPVRASDAERERVVTALRDGAAQGRLTFGELAERVERAYGATTTAELAIAVADLPQAPAAPDRKPTQRIVALMGGYERRGRWHQAASSTAIAVMGGLDLDLRDAVIDGDELVIRAVAVMGGINVVVPEGVEVTLDGFAVMGGNELRLGTGPRRPGSPVLNVHAYALMGGVDVKVQRPGGEPRRRWRFHLPGKKRSRDLPPTA